jgi:hypothetical protein
MGVVVSCPQADVFAGLNSLAPFVLAVLIGVGVFAAVVVAVATGRMLRPLTD